MTNFAILPTKIDGLYVGEIKPKGDKRGYFERVFCVQEYAKFIKRELNILQINRSLSETKGTVRGLHFQWPPYQETKIVSCPRGRLYDVAVDVREGSPTYLQVFGVELSSDNKKFLVIPEGFAHGFQTLTANTEIMYLVSQVYSAEHDDGLNPMDPDLSIQWPIKVTVRSEKDTSRPFLKNRDFSGVKADI